MNSSLRPAVQPAADGVDPISTWLSCLLDGEVERERCEATIRRLQDDERLLQEWALLNAAGDALRSSDVACWHRPEFVQRVAKALAREPTILAPGRNRARRWIGSALAATAAAVVVVIAATRLQAPAQPAVVAQAGGDPTVPATLEKQAAAPAAIERLPAMERYLMEHRELARVGFMPEATAYLRTSGSIDRTDAAR